MQRIAKYTVTTIIVVLGLVPFVLGVVFWIAAAWFTAARGAVDAVCDWTES